MRAHTHTHRVVKTVCLWETTAAAAADGLVHFFFFFLYFYGHNILFLGRYKSYANICNKLWPMCARWP